MKASKISLMVALIAGVVLAYSPALRAEEGKEGKASKTHQGRPEHGAAMKEHLDKMAEDLKLTADQKAKVETAFKEQGEKMRGMRDLSPDERREKGKAMREEMTKKMKGILTAEQFEKWEKNRPQGGPRGFGGQGHGPKKSGDEKK
jgi:Spy/CpxP family protein refolding chaperone